MSYNSEIMWDTENRRIHGDSFSAYCDYDLLIPCNATGGMKQNPCINDSCYYDLSPILGAMGNKKVQVKEKFTSEEILSVLSEHEKEEVKRRLKERKR